MRRPVPLVALALVLALSACASSQARPHGTSVDDVANAIATQGAPPTTALSAMSTTAPKRSSAPTAPTTTVAPPETTAPQEPPAAAPSQPPMVDGKLPPYVTADPVPVARPDAPGDAFAAFDDSLVHSLIGRGAIAVSVAVAKDGKVVHRQAFGLADPFTGAPAQLGSTFRIASISKLMLAVAIMRLSEQGAINLDSTPIPALAQHLGTPMGDPRMASVTVRQLLGHLSGFPEYERTFFGGLVDDCSAAAVRGISRKLGSDPGTQYKYSNMNYCLLGLVVQQATGRPYDQVVQDEVLTPVGISDMHVEGTFETRPGDVLHPTTETRKFMEALGAAGNWAATPVDLVTVLDALDSTKPGPKLVRPDTLAAMQSRPPVQFTRPDVWYGLGMIVWDNGSGWGHTGTLENARSMVFHRPDGITWAVVASGNYPTDAEKLRGMVDKALATVTSWPSD
jgi:D-alanyl-D-alanine carboxypeptidase